MLDEGAALGAIVLVGSSVTGLPEAGTETRMQLPLGVDKEGTELGSSDTDGNSDGSELAEGAVQRLGWTDSEGLELGMSETDGTWDGDMLVDGPNDTDGGSMLDGEVLVLGTVDKEGTELGSSDTDGTPMAWSLQRELLKGLVGPAPKDLSLERLTLMVPGTGTCLSLVVSLRKVTETDLNYDLAIVKVPSVDGDVFVGIELELGTPDYLEFELGTSDGYSDGITLTDGISDGSVLNEGQKEGTRLIDGIIHETGRNVAQSRNR